MNRFFAALFFLMINSSSIAQFRSEYVLFSLDEAQINAIISVIEYYKVHYSRQIYGLAAVDRDGDIVFSFGTLPSESLPLKKMQRGGGSKIIQITYSKKLSKITKAIEVYTR